MKILITGGSGFIGTNVVDYYLSKGWEVGNVDLNVPKHEKAKASGRSDMETLRMSTRRSQLQCQMIEALKLESEFLDRKIKAGEELIAAQNHFIDLRTREDNTNEESTVSDA